MPPLSPSEFFRGFFKLTTTALTISPGSHIMFP
jgi:hypothetical protein